MTELNFMFSIPLKICVWHFDMPKNRLTEISGTQKCLIAVILSALILTPLALTTRPRNLTFMHLN